MVREKSFKSQVFWELKLSGNSGLVTLNKNSIINKFKLSKNIRQGVGPGRVAQSVTCLATDASLTADPGVAS